MSINPWNAGPGELPGDPENDPSLWATCNNCRHPFPMDEVHWYDRTKQWLCVECGLEVELNEPPDED